MNCKKVCEVVLGCLTVSATLLLAYVDYVKRKKELEVTKKSIKVTWKELEEAEAEMLNALKKMRMQRTKEEMEEMNIDDLFDVMYDKEG